MSVDQLGEELLVMPVTVRAHVNVLERDHLLKGSEHRTGRAGRPSIVYSLTQEAEELFPKSYDNLARGIFDNVRELHGEDTMIRVVEKMGEDMAIANSGRIQGKDMAEKVEEATQVMNRKGYLATWKKQGGKYVLVAHNCPYLHVAEHCPEVCGMEVAFLKKALSTDVKLENSMVSGSLTCTFSIDPR